MTGSRPYRENVSIEQALAELLESAGSQFDAACVRALAELVSDDLPAVAARSAPREAHADDDSYLQSRTGMP